jgi:hypothetical protein
MVRIQSLRNDELGINLPQMAFERRVDDIIDFNVIRLTEKSIWQALEKSGIDYQDWLACKVPGQQVLNMFIELKDGYQIKEKDLADTIYKQLTNLDKDEFTTSVLRDDTINMLGFNIEVKLLPKGTFASYTARRQAEGADLAHLKPPHVNPPERVLSIITAEAEETIIVIKSKAKEEEKTGTEKVTVS